MLSTYALITLDELKEVLQLAGSGQDAVLEGVINRASESIETFLGRELVTRGSLTEYHTRDSSGCDLYLGQLPLTTITTVKEGAWSGGTWTASATLVANTDYVADMAAGKLSRLSSGAQGSWARGFESIQVVYAAGYATTAAVPQAIKDVAIALAARKFGQIKRGGDFSAQSVSDGIGSVSRFLPADLLRMDREALAAFRLWNYGTQPRRA